MSDPTAMPNIQNSLHPLAFAATGLPPAFAAPPGPGIQLRTSARALEGMQKEAVVSYGRTGKAWRMVCDEGPYLNGTDLAPFPLAFFCTGMVNSYLSAFCRLLDQQGIARSRLVLRQDNYYSMEGSALAGTMTGSALPVQLQLESDCNADPALLEALLRQAVTSTAVGALLGSILHNRFSIRHNDHPIPCGRVAPCEPIPQRPAHAMFDALTPESTSGADDIISKLRSAEIHQGVAGGAGSSLASDQKRVLHMQGICTVLPDGRRETLVDLYSPIGSQFRFLGDDSSAEGGQDRAPCGLSYLNAGIAFCYLTQIGRYAHIRKKPLIDYCVVQDMAYQPQAGDGYSAVDDILTHVWLDSDQPDDYARQVVDMSEQTCFLHAACRMPVEVNIKAV
jgi:uncharacterized OsmC-like protein